jgi:hypothetical protein
LPVAFCDTYAKLGHRNFNEADMVTRADIETEAEWVQRLIALTNPTGRLHSATPWAASGEHDITAAGATIATFRHAEDRDVAAYFVNSHAGIISLLRSMAESWWFAAQATDDDALRSYANDRAEYCRTFAELFSRLGKPLDEPCHARIEGTQNLCTREAGHEGEHRCSVADVDERNRRGK